MTIPVPLHRLAETLHQFGSAVLVTLPAGSWAKAHTVDPVVDGDALLVADAPGSAVRNVAANPLVTLAWQPLVRHGHTLLVDGRAEASGADLRIRVDHAILHRPAAHADGPAWTGPTGLHVPTTSGNEGAP